MPDKTTKKSATRCETRKVGFDSGRWVCSGRNRTYSRGKTWGPVGETGYRDRPFESPTGRRKAGAAGSFQDIRANSPKSARRLRGGQHYTQTSKEKIASNTGCPSTGRFRIRFRRCSL